MYNYLGVIVGMNIHIYDYLVRHLLKSNAFYHVNGTPEKRLMRIKEYAWLQYHDMTDADFERILRMIEIERKNKKN